MHHLVKIRHYWYFSSATTTRMLIIAPLIPQVSFQGLSTSPAYLTLLHWYYTIPCPNSDKLILSNTQNLVMKSTHHFLFQDKNFSIPPTYLQQKKNSNQSIHWQKAQLHTLSGEAVLAYSGPLRVPAQTEVWHHSLKSQVPQTQQSKCWCPWDSAMCRNPNPHALLPRATCKSHCTSSSTTTLKQHSVKTVL